ncbi:MAG: hypothetical protein JWR15_1572 [Prosthecobacter sp.]|nr:hypothetical protein [Prosthecobacter sp.]
MKRLLSLIACLACCLSACSTTAEKNEKAAIKEAGLRYLKANSDPRVGAVKIVIEEVNGNYARLGVTPVLPTTDPATMYLRKNQKTGVWEGLTLGTGWSPEDFEAVQIPESIRD